MRYRSGWALLLLLLVGCSPPRVLPTQGEAKTPTEAVEPPVNPAPPPVPTRPAIERTSSIVQVADLQPNGRPYLWSPDGSRVAFQDRGGLWSISPDGETAVRIAEGFTYRELVDWTEEGGLVWLEAQPDGLAVVAVQPGAPGAAAAEPRTLALLTAEQVGQAGQSLWRHMKGSRLVLASEGRPVWKIDLATGQVERLSDQPLTVHYGAMALSPDGHTLAFKLSNRADPVRLLDLEGGALRLPQEGGVHLGWPVWSPAASGATGAVWAVRAAAPGSGLPTVVGGNMVEGATHLVVGDGSGRVRRLEPPEPLQLVGGPFWSPDGRLLAVTAGTVRGVDQGQGSGLWPSAGWVVEVESGRWRKAGDLPVEGWLAGFHPDGRHLLAQVGSNRMERWPLAGGAASAEPVSWWQPETAIALGEQRFIYLTTGPTGLALMLGGGQSGPLTILGAGGFKFDLSVRGEYAAVVERPDGQSPRLVLIDLP